MIHEQPIDTAALITNAERAGVWLAYAFLNSDGPFCARTGVRRALGAAKSAAKRLCKRANAALTS